MLYAYWFRKDLRVNDNKALSEFISVVRNRFNKKKDKIIFFYIKGKNSFSYYGEKRIKFLYECLNDLYNTLKKFGFDLEIYSGSSGDVIKNLCENSDEISLYANKQYEPYNIKRDKLIYEIIKQKGTFNLFNDTVLSEPGSILKDDKSPYIVYTPFKKKFLNLLNINSFEEYNSDLNQIREFSKYQYKSVYIEKINILSENFNLKNNLNFKGGRKEGFKLLNHFLNTRVFDYHLLRDFPSINGTSLISPHLHFGTISVRECFNLALKQTKNKKALKGVQTWISELIWREFYYQIAFHFPYIINGAFIKRYDNIEWENDKIKFDRWCNGLTGYPIVDAGMRQLVKEGWMHNRVRMITAMFLTKDLLIDWRWGEKFFAEHLIDLDFANNNGGWQWSASTGCDSQPYFRIFNPYLQSVKFDPDGVYIKKYVPELKNLDGKNIHKPDLELIKSEKYPTPIIDHFKMKEIAILKFKSVSN